MRGAHRAPRDEDPVRLVLFVVISVVLLAVVSITFTLWLGGLVEGAVERLPVLNPPTPSPTIEVFQ